MPVEQQKWEVAASAGKDS